MSLNINTMKIRINDILTVGGLGDNLQFTTCASSSHTPMIRYSFHKCNMQSLNYIIF